MSVFTIATVVQIGIGATAKNTLSPSFCGLLIGNMKYNIPIHISKEDQ
jgi:hypothetical protein